MKTISRDSESVNRRSKETLLKRSDSRERVKKTDKMIGKWSNSAFFSVSEDLSPETKEIVDYSTESDMLTKTSLSQSPLLSPDPVLTASSAISGTSLSINFTDDKENEEILVEINGSFCHQKMKMISRGSESVNQRSKETLLKRSDSRERVKKFDKSVMLSPDPVLTASISGTTSLSMASEKERKNTYFTEHSGYAGSSQPRLGSSQGRSRKLPSEGLGSPPRRHPPTLDKRGRLRRRHAHPYPRKHQHQVPTSFLKLVVQWGPGVRSRYGQATSIRGRITIHGLWANERISELSADFDLPLEDNLELIWHASYYWPNVLADPNTLEFPSSHDLWLWKHEWTRHGRFIGKELPDYMKFTMDWFKRVKRDAEYYLRKNCNSRRGGRLDVRGFIEDMQMTNRDASVHSTWTTYSYERGGCTRYFEQQELQEVRLYCTPDSSVPVDYLPRMDASQYNRYYDVFVLNL